MITLIIRPFGTSINSMGIERRVKPSWTVMQLKESLYPILGISPNYQVLMTATNAVIGPDHAQLDSISNIQDGQDVFVKDSNPFKGSIVGEQVEKYVMNDDVYD